MVSRWRRASADESGQVLPIVLGLVAFIFIIGTALAAQASTALRAGAANSNEADLLLAAHDRALAPLGEPPC